MKTQDKMTEGEDYYFRPYSRELKSEYNNEMTSQENKVRKYIEQSGAKINSDAYSHVFPNFRLVRPFDKVSEYLKIANCRLASAEEVADAAEGNPFYDGLCGVTKEAVVYVPSKGIFLTKNSPIIANAEEAVKCHKNHQAFYLTPEQLEQSLEGAIEVSESFSIPADEFGENEVAKYLFGHHTAGRYFFPSRGYSKLKSLDFGFRSMREKPSAEQLYFRGRGTIWGSDYLHESDAFCRWNKTLNGEQMDRMTGFGL